MTLSHAQLMKKYGRGNYRRANYLRDFTDWNTVIRQEAMRKVWRGVLEVGLWLQAEQRHRNDKLATAAEVRAEKVAKDRFADHKRISGRYMRQPDIDRLLEESLDAKWTPSVSFGGRRFIAISEPEEKLTAVWEPRAHWEPKGKLFISSGKKVDLGLLEQRYLDKMKEIRYEGSKPVLYLDSEADLATTLEGKENAKGI